MSLVVERITGLVTVQDLGRPGHMHEGLAPGGALVPELLVAANRAARNADGAAAIEVLGRLVVRADADILVATETADERVPERGARLGEEAYTIVRLLRSGDELTIASDRHRAAYLAVRGGIEAPRVLGGRGTQLSAGIGAPLRPGDRLEAADGLELSSPVLPFEGDGPIRILAGPDGDVPDLLVAAPYRLVPTSDRVGTRLDGALIRADGLPRSRPLVCGAIEVPPDGKPIVLGPENPTCGGYPVVAVIAHADLGRFFAIRLGSFVQFRR